MFTDYYTTFDIYMKEYEIEEMKIVNQFLFECDIDNIDSCIYTEAENSESGNSLINFIKKISHQFSLLIEKMVISVKTALARMKYKKIISENKDKIDNSNEIVEVETDHDNETDKKLNEYVVKLVNLERQLLREKQHAKRDVNSDRVIEHTNAAISSLEKKYEPLFDDVKNTKIVNMALKDAVRFNDKQLKNVNLYFNAIDRNSKKVLREFEKDASYCDDPKKKMIIQKIIQKIETVNRKMLIRRLNKTDRCFKPTFKTVCKISGIAIATLGAIGLGVKVNKTVKAVNKKVGEVADTVNDTVDKVKDTVGKNVTKAKASTGKVIDKVIDVGDKYDKATTKAGEALYDKTHGDNVSKTAKVVGKTIDSSINGVTKAASAYDKATTKMADKAYDKLNDKNTPQSVKNAANKIDNGINKVTGAYSKFSKKAGRVGEKLYDALHPNNK